MRTTLAIEDDILRELKRLAKERNASLTNVANSLLRLGLADEAEAARRPTPYREVVVDLGPPHMNLDQALEIAVRIEDEHQFRKQEQRK